MIDPNGPKFKTHKFVITSLTCMSCTNCSMQVVMHKYYNGRRIDLYEKFWFSAPISLGDISMSCDEFLIKNIIE